LPDPLLSPTLQDHARPREPQEKPWRRESQFWVAFFGGPLAAAAIAYLNIRRFGIAAPRTRWIALIAVASLVAAAPIALALVAAGASSGVRLANQIAGVLAYIPLNRLQRSADRVYRYYSDLPDDESYASLWAPGLAAVIFLGVPVVLVLAGIAEAA
jgi:hypothetical protein